MLLLPEQILPKYASQRTIELQPIVAFLAHALVFSGTVHLKGIVHQGRGGVLDTIDDTDANSKSGERDPQNRAFPLLSGEF